jgi:hypothetical protein
VTKNDLLVFIVKIGARVVTQNKSTIFQPKDKNSTLLYLRNFAMVSNESCDNIRSALPTVDCPDSVCVKFVVQETLSTRAVCSSSLTPIIVRDCWSRVLISDDEDLQLKPYTTKPVSTES